MSRPSYPTARLKRRPLWRLHACTALIVVLLTGTEAAVVLNMRESSLRSAEINLGNVSLALAEQADRALQGLDLVLASLEDVVTAEGVVDDDSYRQKLSGQRIHQILKEKLTALPYINVVSMIGADGKVINFSRYWPVADINVSDRDFYQALRADPTLRSFISAPLQNRADGSWTMFLARPVRASDGAFEGLLLGGIELRYFEALYRTVSSGGGGAISLLRDDGVLLVRYPPGDFIGRTFGAGGWRVAHGAATGVVREASPLDGKMRVKAAHKLTNFPLVMLATQTEDEALRPWTRMVWLLGMITAGCALSIVLASVILGHWLRQQETLVMERAERAELEQASAQAEVNLARERERHAEAESKAKSGFLAMMSHEIRTPMNAVLGLAGSLLDGSLSAAQRQVVEAIRGSGDSLLRILNDILDYSKLDAGRMTFEDAQFSPATLTESAVSVLGPPARAKGLTIEARTEPDVPPGLIGDAGRIRQILVNLVSNAVKFTDVGTVMIHAGCVARDDAQATVEWAVSDTGIGIPPDRIGGLFGEFVQADNSITRRFGGSGLGLAISRRLVEQMGGSIEVTSTLGQGTTFRVRLTLPICATLPEEAPALTDVPTAFLAATAALGRTVRVLFAEDNATNQFVARQLLKDDDIRIDIAADGREAVDAALAFRYDAIFMDMRMPEMDGLAATRLIRARGDSLATVPIIALTANAFADDVKACFDAGMNQFVPKPVNREVLLRALLTAMGTKNPTAVPVPVPMPAVPAASLDLIENAVIDGAALDDLRRSLGDDGIGEMVAMFERETRVRLAELPSLTETLPVLIREVHSLKGAARTVCAPHLAALAADLEGRLRRGEPPDPPEFQVLMAAFEAWRAAVGGVVGAVSDAA